MRRRLTTSVICMRERSSLGCTCTAKMETWRRFHILKHRGGHVCERARREVFKNEGIERASALGELGGNRSCDGLGHAIGDQRDLFVRLNAQAGEDGGAGAGNKFCWIGLRK